MPGGQERILRRRIKSVQSTKKITRAMELIAATRVVKAQQRANAAKPYSRQITAVIENLAAGGTTVAALACGVDVAYPPRHDALFARIAADGLLVSEVPPGAAPHRTRFLASDECESLGSAP